MNTLLQIFTLLTVFYNTVIFSADNKNYNFIPSAEQYWALKKSLTHTNPIITLTLDTWVPIFNYLELKDQYHLALTCTTCEKAFNNSLVYTHSGSTVNFNTERGLSNTVKNFFISDRTQNANLHNQSFCKKIATNKLGGNITFRFGNDKQLILFFESLKSNSSITQLNMSCNGLIEKGVTVLAKSLSQNCYKSLKSLILTKNYISFTGLIFLLTLLPQLEELNVSENPISCTYTSTSDGTLTSWKDENNTTLKAIGTVIGNLKKLYLNQCNFSGNQIDWMIDFLKINTKLEELYLADNDINDGNHGHKMELIQAADIDNNTLKILDISNNEVCFPLNYAIRRKNLKVIQ